jgi:hypothetical protein
MKDETKNIICTECGASISIDDALTHQIENKLKKEYEGKEKSIRESIEKDSAKKLEQDRVEMEKKVKAQILKDTEAEKVASSEKNKLLEEQLAEKDAKLKEANKNELELRKATQKLKEDKESFEIESARKLDGERKQIEEDASRKATEAKQAEIDQYKKQVSDAQKANDELNRKLAQGSQQTQGEVQELALEELLREAFIYDDISPVGKGINGADVIQTVKTKSGVECGKIIWESKKTKTWTEGWIQKLKDDQRLVKADLAVIVTSAMPQGTSGIVQKDNVWVCDIKLALSIATLLRHSLETVAREKSMSVGKNEKVEILYAYLTGTEFKQRIEVIVETFSSMKTSLDKEKLYFTKTWAEKEKQIDRVIQNTVGIYGDLSGVVQLQKIESLELPSPKEIEE